MRAFWDEVRRLRTWLFNSLAGLLLVLPDLLNAPELLAVLPAQYHKWVFLAALLVNVLMRPRPAVLPDDPEVDMRKSRVKRRR